MLPKSRPPCPAAKFSARRQRRSSRKRTSLRSSPSGFCEAERGAFYGRVVLVVPAASCRRRAWGWIATTPRGVSSYAHSIGRKLRKRDRRRRAHLGAGPNQLGHAQRAPITRRVATLRLFRPLLGGFLTGRPAARRRF